MKISVLGSSSAGNGYIIQNDREALILECGCKVESALKALDYNTSKVLGCIITHEHGDHAKYIDEYSKKFPIYASSGTYGTIDNSVKFNHYVVCKLKQFTIGNFKIIPFDTVHDAREPLGFIIEHEEIGRLVFITDSAFVKYKFGKVDIFMVECNYNKIEDVQEERRARLINSHMNLETSLELVKSNDISKLRQIVLIHISEENGDKELFKKKFQEEFGVQIEIAEKGKKIFLL